MIPVITDLNAMIDWFVERGVEPTADELATACSRVGRIRAPALLISLHDEDLLSREAAVACAGDWQIVAGWLARSLAPASFGDRHQDDYAYS
jgi:hypothetical protein